MDHETANKPVLRQENTYIIFGVTLMAVMGVSSITPAFPAMIKYFQISPQQVGWLITSFTIPGIILTPFAGILADRLGRKVILIISLLLFGTGGTACFFYHDFHTLLGLRFVQGAGAAALATLNITLIGDIFTGQKRTQVMGYNASVLSVGAASYPLLGGLLATFGWPFAFLLSALAFPIIIWVVYRLDNPEPEEKQALKGYFARVWKNINQKSVWGLFVVNILLFVVLYGAFLTYFPLLMEQRFSAGSAKIGLYLSILSITTAIVSSQIDRIQKHISPKWQLLYSALFYALSSWVVVYSHEIVWVVSAMILFGLGHGMIVPGVMNLLVAFAPMTERAMFLSINSVVLRVGQTIGPVFIGLFYTFGRLTGAFYASMGISLLMFVITWIMITPPKEKEG